MTSAKGPVIIYRLVGGKGIGGNTWFLGEQKGGSLKTLDMGGGGSRKSSNVIRGGHFSEVTFKAGIG